MLIVEGPDGSGKTTFCRELVKLLPTHIYAHFSRLPPGFDYYQGYIDRMSPNVVQDRFHISEIIYSELRGDKSPLTLENFRLIDAKLRLIGAYTVVILPDPNDVYDRWHEGQMYDREKTTTAARLYRRGRVQSESGRWSYDLPMPDGGGVTADVDSFIIPSKGGYPTKAMAVQVASRYVERRREVESIFGRILGGNLQLRIGPEGGI